MVDMKYTYQKNIDLIKLLYESDFYKVDLRSKGYSDSMLKPIIDAIYIDPDREDKNLFIGDDFLNEFEGISFGIDGLCGWKILFDINKGNKKWLEAYSKIRGSEYGYLIWPDSTDEFNHKTINQEKYRVFGDRIDYTLFDIKLYYSKKYNNMCRLAGAYEGTTKIFLDKIKSFDNFIYKMKLGHFVDKNNNVIKLDEEEGIINLDEHKSYIFSPRWGSDRKEKEFSTYIDNIVKICSKNQLK